MATSKEHEIPGIGGVVTRHIDEGTVVDRYVLLREKSVGKKKEEEKGRRPGTTYETVLSFD